MKSDVKKFSEKYYEEILKLPRKDLGKILHEQHFKAMKEMISPQNSVDANKNLIDEINTIILKSNPADRLYLFSHLYIAILETCFWLGEDNRRQTIKTGLSLAVGNLLLVQVIKDAVKKAKKGSDRESYEDLYNTLDEVISELLIIPNTMKDELGVLEEVLKGERLESEIYNPLERVKELQSLGYDTFLNICEDIYRNEKHFTSCPLSDQEKMRPILKEYLKKKKFKLVSK